MHDIIHINESKKTKQNCHALLAERISRALYLSLLLLASVSLGQHLDFLSVIKNIV